MRGVFDKEGKPFKCDVVASAHAWGQYAASVGVEVPEGADRAAIIDALTAAGKPTE